MRLERLTPVGITVLCTLPLIGLAKPTSAAAQASDLSMDLSWCPEMGSAAPRVPGRLRIATWNIANLHAEDGRSTYVGDRPSVERSAIDYERIRCYVRMFDPDVLAVQEVDGEEALLRVIDPEVYEVHVSSRAKPDFMGGKQNTGFAYKRGLSVEERPDFTELGLGSATLRRGTRIDVEVNGVTIEMLSVHLRSGCFSNADSGGVCPDLFAQLPVLERWVDEAATRTPFVVLGDFNRRFTIPGDDFWRDFDDGVPANSDLLAVTQDMPITCRDNRYTEFIDHIVLDRRAARYLDRSSFRHVSYRQEDREAWDRISDHCPVVVELWVDAN